MKDFSAVSANPNNPKWENLIKRENVLTKKESDLRSEFERDYNRILNSKAYRRLKHKTQVFYAPSNDHICTRIEHVHQVECISYTIAHTLGLNTELTRAIATSHDVGHSPFGHEGEKILNEISLRDLKKSFWHEKNGVDIVDNIELLENSSNNLENLSLTYAVRDGILSHCGEVDENFLKPREEFIDLSDYTSPNQFAPYTWEACVVKIADKISYIIRDIEDAIGYHIIDKNLDELYKILKSDISFKINKTTIINNLVYDLCSNSSPEKGLAFSPKQLNLLNKIKKFNYDYIYNEKHFCCSKTYFKLVINQIYDSLKDCFDGKNTLKVLEENKKFAPTLFDDFIKWITRYWNLTDRTHLNLNNKVIFDMTKESDYIQAIIYYISGMTDSYAISSYMGIVSF